MFFHLQCLGLCSGVKYPHSVGVFPILVCKPLRTAEAVRLTRHHQNESLMRLDNVAHLGHGQE